jgi:peptidoglycan/LPS O-acetylase OafA/YrhL
LRIYPAYWYSVAVVVALPFVIEGLSAIKTGTFVGPTAAGHPNLGFLDYSVADWFRALTLTQVFTPMARAHDLQYKFTPLNAVYWTLAIEYQFYLVMAVALALRANAIRLLIGVTLLSIPVWYLGKWDVVGIFLPYWPMFAAGIALYLIVGQGLTLQSLVPPNKTRAKWMSAIGVTGVVIALAALGREVTDVGFAVAFAVALWFVHPLDDLYSRGIREGGRATRTALVAWRNLGLMSYSLYLLHGRLQFLAQQLWRQVLSSGIAFDLLSIGTTCCICWVFYLFCEKPFVRSRLSTPASSAAVRLSSVNA